MGVKRANLIYLKLRNTSFSVFARKYSDETAQYFSHMILGCWRPRREFGSSTFFAKTIAIDNQFFSSLRVLEAIHRSHGQRPRRCCQAVNLVIQLHFVRKDNAEEYSLVIQSGILKPYLINHMKKLIQSFGFAVNGIVAVWREERNFRIEVTMAGVVSAFGIYLEFTKLEWAIILVCIAAVLAAEILNTAVEELCNKIEPNINPIIGKIKDMTAGLVLIVSLFSVVIGVMVFTNHL